MLDHIGFSVSDLARSRAFYEQALAPLGVVKIMELTAEQTGGNGHVGFGENGKPYFWIGDRADNALRGCLHVAFVANDRAAVDAFHRAALAAGGKDNGAPGLRPHYHASYYGAFVVDPDGHNVEAVCHKPE
ncbi:MAG TPA: VOC family protein [Nevskia sp.]|nr:VOC family protein [Nevskia sp.]